MKSHQPRKKRPLRPLVLSAMLLAACSDDDAATIPNADDYARYTLEDLQILADAGNHERVLSIVSNRRRLDLAGTDELQLALTINLQQLDGIAAEVLVERLQDHGVAASDLYIPKARALFLQGELNKALAVLDAEDIRPEDAVDADLVRADILGLQGETETQTSLYQRVIAARPDDFRGYLGLALQAFEQARFADAEKLAADALARDDQDPIVNYVVGATALYQGDFDKAQQFLEASIALRPGNVAALTELANLFIRRGDVASAEATLDRIYAMAPDNRMARFLTAQISAGKGNLEEAEKQLILSEEFARTYLPATRTYGLVTYGLGKHNVASRFLERFLRAVPSDRNVRMALVDSLIQQAKGAEALGYLAPVLAETPDDVDANLYAASAKAAEGAPLDAITYYGKALAVLEAAPDTDPAQIRQLKTKIAISRFLAGQSEEATRQLKAIQSAKSDDFDTLVLLANIHLRRYDQTGLEATLEQMEKVRPDSIEGHNFRGVMAYRAGDPLAAVAAYDAALAQNPDYFSALKNRGLALLAAKKPEAAQQDLLKAAAMNPEDGQIQAFLGRSFLELSDFDSASSALKKAEAVLPRDPVIQVDYSEALAGRGLLLQAIQRAEAAKHLAAGRQDLIDYIDTTVATWQSAYEEQAALKADDDARLRMEAQERLARERAAAKAAEDDKDDPDR